MTNTVTIAPRLLNVKEAAAYLAISERKLWSITKAETIPAVRMSPRLVRYDRQDLDEFIQRAKTGGLDG